MDLFNPIKIYIANHASTSSCHPHLVSASPFILLGFRLHFEYKHGKTTFFFLTSQCFHKKNTKTAFFSIGIGPSYLSNVVSFPDFSPSIVRSFEEKLTPIFTMGRPSFW